MRPEAVVLPLAAVLVSSFCPTNGPDRPTSVEEPPRPNIVLVISDDQRYDTLGCTGNTVIETPNLDRLAAHGVLFENAYVVTSLCAPSRASILTGLYPHGHGIHYYREDGDPLAEIPIFPELLQQSGYETAFIGKWHLPLDGLNPYRGFDHWVGFAGQGKYFDQTLNVDGQEVEAVGFSADVLTDYAVRFVEKDREGPFFLMLSLKNPHSPFTPPDRHANTIVEEDIPLPQSRFFDAELRFDHFRAIRKTVRRFVDRVSDDQLRDTWKEYLGLISSLDEAVGALSEALERSDRAESTIMVFVSDNGLLLGDHGMLNKKQHTFDPSIHIPLIISLPGMAAGERRESRIALNVDLAPTLLELAGCRALPRCHGRSLVPLLLGTNIDWRRSSLHYHLPEPDEDQDRLLEYAVHDGRWSYMLLLAAGREEALFDLDDDPNELVDLSGDPAHADTMESMRAQLDELLVQLDVPIAWRPPVEDSAPGDSR